MNIKKHISKKVVGIGLAAGLVLGAGGAAFAYFTAAPVGLDDRLRSGRRPAPGPSASGRGSAVRPVPRRVLRRGPNPSAPVNITNTSAGSHSITRP